MKIVDKIAGEAIPFSLLPDGQVFKGEFGGVYLKIVQDTVCRINGRGDSSHFNAFDLEGHYLVYFSGETKVTPVEATLTIISYKET